MLKPYVEIRSANIKSKGLVGPWLSQISSTHTHTYVLYLYIVIPISSTSHLLMLVSGKTALSAFLEALSGFHAVWAFFGVSCLWAIWPVLGPLWCASSLISWCAPPCICDWQISLPLLVSPVAFWDPWLFILDSKNRSRSQKASERNRDSTCPLVHLLESSLSAAILCSTKNEI